MKIRTWNFLCIYILIYMHLCMYNYIHAPVYEILTISLFNCCWWQNKYNDWIITHSGYKKSTSLLFACGGSFGLYVCSISSSSGCMWPAMTNEWRGGPRSRVAISFSVAVTSLWSCDPTLAIPTQMLSSDRSEIYNEYQRLFFLRNLRQFKVNNAILQLFYQANILSVLLYNQLLW